MSSELTIEPADPTTPEARALLAASDADLLSRYPPESIYTVSAAEAAGTNAFFAIARIDCRAAGCGALVPLDDRTAEIKRMFVVESARGKGLGRRLLVALEKAGIARGMTRIRLETGPNSPEAIALYESAGYRVIPSYGEYVGDEFSVCYEKQLT